MHSLFRLYVMEMLRRTILRDRSVLALSGPEIREFLQGLVTNDLSTFDQQPAIYAALLTPQGKILFDFFLVQKDPDAVYLDCAQAQSAELLKRLSLYKLRSKVEISETALGVAASWDGEDVPLPSGNTIAYADPRLHNLGWRIIGPKEVLGAAFPDTLPSYHAHRIALGVPDSADLPPDTTFPLDAGFEELNGVSFKKGCYVGQEVTSRMKHRASARKRFFIAESEKGLAQGSPIVAAGREIGIVASGVGAKALALVRLDRVREAEQAGTPLTANEVPIALRPPVWLKISPGD